MSTETHSLKRTFELTYSRWLLTEILTILRLKNFNFYIAVLYWSRTRTYMQLHFLLSSKQKS